MHSVGVCHLEAIAVVQKDKAAVQVHGLLCHSNPCFPRTLLPGMVCSCLQHCKTAVVCVHACMPVCECVCVCVWGGD